MLTFIVNAEGVQMNPPPLHLPKQRYPNAEHPPFKSQPTGTDLMNLEDAIFEHEPFRVDFLNRHKNATDSLFKQTAFKTDFLNRQIDLNDDAHLHDLTDEHSRKWVAVLTHCWSTLGWRPSAKGKRVWTIHPNNPYK